MTLVLARQLARLRPIPVIEGLLLRRAPAARTLRLTLNRYQRCTPSTEVVHRMPYSFRLLLGFHYCFVAGAEREVGRYAQVLSHRSRDFGKA
jgi:hypothetical protein